MLVGLKSAFSTVFFFPARSVHLIGYGQGGMGTKAHDLFTKMQPHQQRVVDEKTELDDKITKLAAFIGSDTYKTLEHEDQALLSGQLNHMCSYSETLSLRIERF
ncbi:crAss001_48 related protein [Providencia sp. PROV036]|uniref:crAss001_48 related protein n=1 Tax=Providencia sp. PROV036 TaxID=2949767 RepID=UPI003FA6A3CA